jgi:apolipoprotein N-acyltransferase
MRKIVPHKATAWAILAGIAYVLCFPSYDLPLLSVLFLPCLIFSLRALESRKQAWRLGFLLSAMIAWGGFHWIIYVAQNFGQLPLPGAIGLMLLYCLVAAPQLLAFFVLGERLRFRVEKLPLFFRPLFWAAFYVGFEYLARFPKIFPEHLGNTLLHSLPIAQSASLGGVSLLSFLPLWFGASLAYLRIQGLKAWPALAASAILPLLLFVWGGQEIERVNAQPMQELRVGFVQHNMDDVEKLALLSSSREAVDSVVRKLLEHTRNLAAQKPDLILWPETSYPVSFPARTDSQSIGSFSKAYADMVKETVRAAQVPLLFGGYESTGRQDYNSAILLGPSGEPLSSYRKVVLLLFGEYIPFSDWFPMIKELNPQMGDFARGPGPEPVLFPWKNGLQLGINICYEAILPEFMRGMAKNGARLFLNITKDSWFGNTFEPWQHFQLSALRSIEHQIPMVRITNTGLSGIVSATGETKLLSPPFHTAVEIATVKIPVSITPTLYTRFGEWFAISCILLTIALLFWKRSAV